MTSPQRQRVAAADLIARHLVAYHADTELVLQADRAATLANALICADFRADGYRAAAASLGVIAQEPPLDGGPTAPGGIRAEAAATLSQLVRHEEEPAQRLRLLGVIGGLLFIWRPGTVHHQIALDVRGRLA
jgi:hypothetical protein